MRTRQTIEPATANLTATANLRIEGEVSSRNPAETVVTNLRIKEALRRALEREAEKHQVSLNKEMVWRLEKSFDDADKLTLHQIVQDLQINWLRFNERFLELEIEEGILTAIDQGDLEAARMAVNALRTARANAARPRLI
jgi:hypothetical protein